MKLFTIAIDLAMRARLLAVALDFLATAFIARARHTTPLLQRDQGAWARRGVGGRFGVILSIVPGRLCFGDARCRPVLVGQVEAGRARNTRFGRCRSIRRRM